MLQAAARTLMTGMRVVATGDGQLSLGPSKSGPARRIPNGLRPLHSSNRSRASHGIGQRVMALARERLAARRPDRSPAMPSSGRSCIPVVDGPSTTHRLGPSSQPAPLFHRRPHSMRAPASPDARQTVLRLRSLRTGANTMTPDMSIRSSSPLTMFREYSDIVAGPPPTFTPSLDPLASFMP